MMEIIKAKRSDIEEIILTALRRAINEGLNLEIDAIWVAGKVEYIESILESWMEDEDGKLAIDRLMTLIIH